MEIEITEKEKNGVKIEFQFNEKSGDIDYNGKNVICNLGKKNEFNKKKSHPYFSYRYHKLFNVA